VCVSTRDLTVMCMSLTCNWSRVAIIPHSPPHESVIDDHVSARFIPQCNTQRFGLVEIANQRQIDKKTTCGSSLMGCYNRSSSTMLRCKRVTMLVTVNKFLNTRHRLRHWRSSFHPCIGIAINCMTTELQIVGSMVLHSTCIYRHTLQPGQWWTHLMHREFITY
jgi:hypothetical protein